LRYHEQGEAPATRGERLLVIGFLILLMSAVFTCFAYFFTSITSEKQARVTEQIVSAIPMQTWMDGKLLGISLLGIKSMLTLSLWAGLVAFGVHVFAPEQLAKLGGIGVDKLLVGLCFILLGLAFWNSFLAGVAATIDDPNNSTRSALMFIPSIPSFLAFPMLDHADNAAVVVMSWLPLTSMAVMPVRYALTEVALWEVLGAALLLLWCVHLMRRYASRIFRAGMFLYGKEPSWREMWAMLARE
jgi:ABC-2 type transport system permease protein